MMIAASLYKTQKRARSLWKTETAEIKAKKLGLQEEEIGEKFISNFNDTHEKETPE